MNLQRLNVLLTVTVAIAPVAIRATTGTSFAGRLWRGQRLRTELASMPFKVSGALIRALGMLRSAMVRFMPFPTTSTSRFTCNWQIASTGPRCRCHSHN